MTVPIDPITETDLHAYVDDQLEVQRRIEVEAYLSREPETAARVMADLRSRDELRLALADMPRIGRIGTMDAARRLERGISQDRWFTRVSRAAGLIACIGVGWVAHAQLGTLSIGTVNASTPAPRYVADARQAYQASLVRATLPSAAKSAAYDREEIRAATAIALPELPAGWTVEDAQIFPSTFGPSVEVAIKADTLGSLALFAVRPGSFDVIPATVARDGQTAAYWQIGEVAYVLIADVEGRKLEQVAVNLAKTLY
ncbi:anti-sigma factor RsiW [Rhodoligotrophos appendicifer]|uniref:anti-sigma factor family protein n=1 Tax=Rhodoligotrophos appendicifer TaxID=987056 RepID=UPI00117ECA0B|nr:anti-sigma factor [Rhodoligotrophos appendicifer]